MYQFKVESKRKRRFPFLLKLRIVVDNIAFDYDSTETFGFLAPLRSGRLTRAIWLKGLHPLRPNSPFGNFRYTRNIRRKFMPYQYKREPLNDDEVYKITNACSTFREKFVIWPLLDTALILS